MPPLVSIILPTYNRWRTLPQAIASVQTQSYPHWELIIVDDGSTDETPRGLAALAEPRLRCVRQPNQGRSAARNRGLALAQGELVAFLDDDDWYLPSRLAQQVAFLQTHADVDLAAAGVYIARESEPPQAGESPWHPWLTWRDQPQLTLARCLYGCPLPICAVMLRRAWLERLSHWFDPELTLLEDTDFFLRLLLAGARFAWLEAFVSVYRLHGGSSQQDGGRYARAYLQLLAKLLASPQMPAALRRQEPALRTHYLLAAACHAYVAPDLPLAHALLQQAAAWQPTLAQPDDQALMQMVVGFAHSPQVSDPAAYVRRVWRNLPAVLTALRSQERQALSLLYMGRVFKARDRAVAPSLHDWLRALYYDAPYWLFQPAAWSVLWNRST